MTEKILKPGRNCWKILPASRVAFLVDGENYYPAFRASAARARHSLLILGWDIDSRMKLLREGEDDGMPEQLGDFLNTVVSREENLHAYLLVWDFAVVYLMEREFFPVYKLGWRTVSRLRFEMDDSHPMGASHHQKIVVVDNRVGFVGGFDLSKWRWDTSEHKPRDPRRIDPDGMPYQPFHDVQMVVEGEVATALGELAAGRWQRATGESLDPARLGPANHAGENSPWPENVEAVLREVPVAISRTEAAYQEHPEIREIEFLHLDAIKAAQHFIYVENQYFTSWKIAEALAARLEEQDGPEIVLVLRKHTTSWLEQNTMDALRARLFEQVRAADRHGRLRIYYPYMPGLDECCISLHAKLMIVDDEFMRVGSANISNRSMGLDTECDLALEADGNPEIRRCIKALREQLIAEHTAARPEQVAAALEAGGGSLISALEKINPREGRRLEVLRGEVSPELQALAAQVNVVDPEKPIEARELMERLLPPEEQRPPKRQLLKMVGILFLFLGLAALWRWTPLYELLDTDYLVAHLQEFATWPGSGLLAMLGVLVGVTSGIPLTVMVITLTLVFGPFHGFIYAFIGGLGAGAVSYGLGYALGRRHIRQLADGNRINQLSRQLGKHGVAAVVTLRLVPVAPYVVINLVAGASHISFRDFMLGTVLGLIPGMLAVTFFADRLEAVLKQPDTQSIVLLGVAVLVVVALGFGVRYWIRRRRTRREKPTATADTMD